MSSRHSQAFFFFFFFATLAAVNEVDTFKGRELLQQQQQNDHKLCDHSDQRKSYKYEPGTARSPGGGAQPLEIMYKDAETWRHFRLEDCALPV